MPGLVIAGGRVWEPGGFVLRDLVVDEGRVISGDPGGRPALDASGLLVAPGFVDLQVNGGFGNDVTADPSSMWEVGAELVRYGVTAWLPTVITAPPGTPERAMEVLREGPPDGYRGALPLGLHLEGPMISRLGAHPREWTRPPSADLVASWGRERGVRVVTLAPELPGAVEVIEELAGRGVVVSLGHSEAGLAEARAGLAAGARMGTHLFNAMRGVDHRDPGLALALLLDPTAVAGLICDGLHVHPEVVGLAWTVKGAAGIALVTDAVAALGMGEGVFRLGAVEARVQGAECRTPEGRLAGSVLTMDAAVRNLMQYTGCEVWQAVASASHTPAGVLDDGDRGSLSPGSRADLVLLDQDLEVVATLVGGEVVFRR